MVSFNGGECQTLQDGVLKHFDFSDSETTKCFECETWDVQTLVESLNELSQPFSHLLRTEWNLKVDYKRSYNTRTTFWYPRTKQLFLWRQHGRCGRFCSFLWNSDDLEEVGINFFSEICKLLYWNSISIDGKTSFIKTDKRTNPDFETLWLGARTRMDSTRPWKFFCKQAGL